MNQLKIEFYDTPDDAPSYRRDQPEVKPASITTVRIVGNGTVEMNPTVDFEIESDGNRLVAMLTGRVVCSLVYAMRGRHPEIDDRALTETHRLATHLGDGLYVSKELNPGHMTLFASDGIIATNTVHLDAQVCLALLMWMKRNTTIIPDGENP